MSLFGNEEAKAITGDVRVATSGATLVGSTGVSVFTTEIKSGDTVVLGTTKRVVKTIEGDATLTLSELTGATGVQTGYIMQAPKYLSDADKKSNVYGVDPTEMGVTKGAGHAGWVKLKQHSGYVRELTLTASGSGYASVTPGLTFSSGGATGVAVMSGGKVASLTLTDGGTYTTTAPTVSIAAPAGFTFSTASGAGVNATSETITFATNHNLSNGDALTYSFNGATGPAGATGPIGLVDGVKYYGKITGATGVQLYSTYAGSIAGTTGLLMNLGATGLAQTHKLVGETATATVTMGGRFNRKTYETIVANGSIASDLEDTIFPDA